jgi:hypothetical protein
VRIENGRECKGTAARSDAEKAETTSLATDEQKGEKASELKPPGEGRTMLPPHRKILLDNDQPSHREPQARPDTDKG